jgi:DNA-directed RNA polymerase specialized sigma24 family protein
VLRKRREEELDDDAAEAIEEPSDNPAVAAEKSDKGEKLRQCLAALSPDHREVMISCTIMRNPSRRLRRSLEFRKIR